ncbi:MAG: ribosome biogenesis GTPase Der [Pyrinomonadaceae bacterium]|nr:ribosome biogenesis GTPase Der [Pyrinomonadaceae bacterium]
MNLPLVAIVGRPNVGKSTLFNRLTKSRRAIVGDEPGITRDRIYGEVDWKSKRFSLVDTGGIVPDDDALIPANIFKQASFAINEAQALIWVVDARAGVTPLDEELAKHLRQTQKPIFIAANKAESDKIESEGMEFQKFGFAEVMPISSEHNFGIGDLLDEVFNVLEFDADVNFDDEKPREIRLAIIGRPNVGKSSLLNKLLGEERVIVSPIAGTTRDSIDTDFEYEDQKFRLIDTAGIRRKGKTNELAEKMSVIMARKSLERADVAVVVIDAVEGVTNLDANIAGYAVEEGCGVILAVNKWDAIADKKTGTVSEFERSLRDELKFLDYAPILTISALDGQRVNKLLPLAVKINQARSVRVSTAKLNQFFIEHISQPRGGGAPAPVKGGVSRLHIKYVTQVGVRPPRFVMFTGGGGGSKAGLHFSYTRYVENRLREEFDFFGTPIKLTERHQSNKRK